MLDREKGGAFRYMDSMGYAPLREQLCRYLMNYGIKTSPENVQIISGAQQGIDIISKAMLRYGDVVFVEKPTFYGAAGAFLSRGGKLIEIPLEEDGMDMVILENFLKLYHPRFIYMMAYYQTPTGISYSMEKKRRLLELAEKYDTYIIEEDDFYDFHYDKEPIVPLKALDYKNRVIYIQNPHARSAHGADCVAEENPSGSHGSKIYDRYFHLRLYPESLGILSARIWLGGACRTGKTLRRREIPQNAFRRKKISLRCGEIRTAKRRCQPLGGAARGRGRRSALQPYAGKERHSHPRQSV